MKGVLLALGFAHCACASCATSLVSDAEASVVPAKRIIDVTFLEAKTGTGQVTIKRDSGALYAACAIRVFVDARPIADLRTREKIVLHVPQGEHVFSARPTCARQTREVSGSVRVGQSIAYRVGYDADLKIEATAF